MTGPLTLDVTRGVATLTLSRPERMNSLNRELGLLLLAGLQTLGRDSAVRCVVLTGAGRAFCAGDDIATLNSMFDGETGEEPSVPGTGDALYLRIVEQIVHLPKPVIAGINGATAGAGLEMACAADLRIMSDAARIGSGLVNIGQMGNAIMLPRVVGPAQATAIYMSGRMLSAEEAYAAGLVHEVVPQERFAARLTEAAQDLAGKPTKAIALFKQARDAAAHQPVEYGLRVQEASHIRNMHEVEDAVEGARAFMEKRPPEFSGR